MNTRKVKEFFRLYGLHYGGIILFFVGIFLLCRFGWDKWFGYVVGITGMILIYIDTRKYQRYLDIITKTGELAVDGIAAKAKEDVEVTEEMLKEMLKKGLLDGWIDEEKLELRLKEWPGGDDEDDEDGIAISRPKIHYTHAKSIICQNCGARIHTKAKRNVKCEYCGEKIKTD